MLFSFKVNFSVIFREKILKNQKVIEKIQKVRFLLHTLYLVYTFLLNFLIYLHIFDKSMCILHTVPSFIVNLTFKSKIKEQMAEPSWEGEGKHMPGEGAKYI